MNPERWKQIKTLFEAAIELRANERPGYLDGKCGSDIELRNQVELLLNSSDAADTFLEIPAAEADTIFSESSALTAGDTTGGLPKNKFVSGTVLDERYRIVGLVGKGGMGEVYKAEDLTLDQTVALKFLPDQLEKSPDALRRFIGEVRIARQVSHPNVCRVFDIGEIEGRHFISMEFIDGDDLSVLLQRIGRLPSDKASEISRQICFGLQSIHDAGILHRDLKPANVIIDRVGKARITDFGIAGYDSEFKAEEIRVGTPAYMSPEQIDGKEVTVKSDIYSLGLLIYEIFTGKQAFQADSLDALLEKQRTTAPRNPSTLVENLEPIVETTINRCLEKHPADRPENVMQVAFALPGGNPLEAAIMAGETPSPEMVAAAPKKGALKPIVAICLLIGIIAGLGLFVFLNTHYKLYNTSPLEKSPEVLAERAKSIVRNLEFGKTPVDSIYEFKSDLGYLNYEDERGNPSGSFEKLKKGQPLGMYFWYRQSPRYIVPSGYSFVTESDPSLTVAGMVNVKLDPLGRLVEFIAVPGQNTVEKPNAKTDWDALFTEAGLDIAKFAETESQWTPPVYSNSRIAWNGSFADHADIPIRIEAASFNGTPVYFQVIPSWDKPLREQEENASVSLKAARVLIIVLYVLVIIGAVFLARRNLLAGRSDLKGALRLGIFYFALLFISEFVLSHHVPTVIGELHVFYEVTSYALIRSFFVFLIYVALEPFVRRWWSELLISWNRLLAGDFRDPMIGRDVLVGALCGLGHTFAVYLGSFLRDIVVGKDIIMDESFVEKSFSGTAATFASMTGLLLNAVSTGFFAMFLLLLFYVLFRKKWLSMLVVWTLVVIVVGLAFVLTQHWAFVISTIILATLVVFVLVRFGLLAMITFWLFFYISWLLPVTLNTSRFYFFDGLLIIGISIAIVVSAFYVSIAGQPVFRGVSLTEGES